METLKYIIAFAVALWLFTDNILPHGFSLGFNVCLLMCLLLKADFSIKNIHFAPQMAPMMYPSYED